jgi:phage tail-like protein
VAEVMRWDLVNAWIAEWRGSVLNAMQREVAIESLTLVFETLQRA